MINEVLWVEGIGLSVVQMIMMCHIYHPFLKTKYFVILRFEFYLLRTLKSCSRNSVALAKALNLNI